MKKTVKFLSVLSLFLMLIIGITSCSKGKKMTEIRLDDEKNNKFVSSKLENPYVGNRPIDFEFIIECNNITVDNMYDHVIVVDCFDEMRILGIRPYESYFVISPYLEKGDYYTPGEVYTVVLADDAKFVGYMDGDQAVLINDGAGFEQKEVSFGIQKEETRKVVYDYTNLRVLQYSKIIDETDEYILVNECPYTEGNVLGITDESNKFQDDTVFIKVSSIEEVKEGYKIYYEYPDAEEIYSELDVYVEEEFDYDKIEFDSIDTNQVIDEIKSTDTFERFANAAKVVNKKASYQQVKSEIKVKFEIGKVTDGVRAKITLSYTYGGLTLSLIFEPTLTVKIKASAKLDIKFLIWKSRLNMDFSVTTAVEMPITLKIEFDYKISDELKEEIQFALSNKEIKEDAILDIFNTESNVSVDDNEISIDLFETPQYQIPYTPLGISLDIDFVIDIQIHVELTARATYTNVTTFGVKTTSSGLKTYSSEEKNFKFNDVVIKGSIEVMAGIRLSGKLGLLSLAKYANVTLSVDFGAYVSLTGKLAFESTDGSLAGFEMTEAVYCFEAGLYIKLSVGYKLFALSDRINLATAKIPLFHIGNELYETKLLGNESIELKTKAASVISKTNLQVKTVNLLTKEITTPTPDISKLKFSFENGEYITVKSGFFKVSADAPVSFEDTLHIIYNDDPELEFIVKVNYINEAMLDGLANDSHGGIYSLDRETHTYTLIGAGFNNVEEIYVIPDKFDSLPVVAIDASAFINNKKIKTVAIPSTVKSIGEQAFYGCTLLESIDISSVDKIGESAFRGCKNLKEVKLSSNITKLPDYIFSGCKSLTSINLDNISEFGSNSFDECDSLRSIKLMNDTTFNGCSFANCDNLQCISTNSYNIVLNDSPFFNTNKNLVIAVPSDKLNYYKNLYEYDKEKFVDNSLVFDDYILEQSGNGYQLKLYIGNNETVSIPDAIGGHSVTSIGSYAFGENVKSVTLPKSVTNISSKAFYNCSNLVELVITNTEKVVTIGTAALWGTNSKLKITVPKKMFISYGTNSKWIQYKSQLKQSN